MQGQPQTGWEVYTADGQKIGAVKEVQGRSFKVNAPVRPDFWLRTGAIGMAGNGRVDLAVTADRLDDAKVDMPDAGNASDAISLLLQMHDEAKAPFRDILSASDPQQAHQMWQQLQPVLKVHEQMEEMHLYRPLREQRPAGSELYDWEPEHQREVDEVEAMIQRSNQMTPTDSQRRTRIDQIRMTLEQHIAEEEGTIFPRIREVWDKTALAKAGQQMAEMKREQLGAMD